MKLPKLFNGRRERLAETSAANEATRQQLAELDARLLQLIASMSGREQLIGDRVLGIGARNVDLSRYYAKTDIQIGNAVDTWTNWGFGRQVAIKAEDPQADIVWQATWDAPINKPIFKEASLHEHSNRVLIDGEFFFVAYITKGDGAVTWRYFKTERITQIIHPENDDAINLYYVVDVGDGRQRAFPDAFSFFSFEEKFESAKLPEGVVDINQEDTTLDNQSIALIVPVQRNIGDDGRGWPQFYKAPPWTDAYAQMLREYSQVWSAVAAYVDKIKAKGGSKTITDIVTSLQSSMVNQSGAYVDTNPAPTAGSTWVENDAMERTRMPLGTQAGDAQTGSMIIAAQVATALGVKLSDVGRPDAFQNKAIADVAAESPQQGWQRYQTFWVSIWQQLVEITLRARERFTPERFSSYGAAVSMSLPIDVATSDIKTAMDGITAAANAATLDFDVATRANTALTVLMLLDLNVSDVDAVLSKPQAEETAAVTPAQLGESHNPVTVAHVCPLCGHGEAYSYADHGPLLVCVECERTYDPEVE